MKLRLKFWRRKKEVCDVPCCPVCNSIGTPQSAMRWNPDIYIKERSDDAKIA